jgi:dienelactone hydrolase
MPGFRYPSNMDLRRRSLLLGSASAVALAAAGTLAPARPARAEDLPYELMDFDWQDGRRDRAVPVRLYLPNLATTESPVPLVVFSHGIGGSRVGYRHLGSHWASEGFASLHVQHVGSDRSLWTAGNPFTVVGRLWDAARESEAVARVHDLRFAIDQVLGGALGARLDARRIVAAGHSYGANTTLLAAGARVERPGLEATLHDPRLRAAIVLSAPPFYGEASPQRILAPVQVPSLHITSTEDVIRIPGYYSAPEDRLAVFEAIGSPRKALAVFSAGSHSIFTDRTVWGDAELNARIKAATRELTTAFLREVLQGDEHQLGAWPRRHADILSRFESLG